MGFLSGVLGAVKDDDAVKTYDKNDENNINTVISTLKDSIGSGRNGLVASVRAVKGWLVQYWQEVDGKNKGVIDSLSNLINNLGGKYLAEIKQTDNLRDQLTAWMTTIGNIDSQLTAMDAQQVGALDGTLKEKITHEIKCIKKAVIVLHDSAGDGVFGLQVGEVDNVLVTQENALTKKIEEESKSLRNTVKEQEQKIKKEIKSKSDGLQNTLDTELRSILRNVTELQSQRKKQIQNIKTGLQDVYEDSKGLTEEIDGNFMSNIRAKFEYIKTQIKTFTTDSPNNTPLLDGFNTIKLQVSGLVEKVQNDLQTLKKRIEILKKSVDGDALKKGSNIIREQLEVLKRAKEPLDMITAAKQRAGGDSQHNLELKFHGIIADKLSELIKNVNTAIGQLHSVVDRGTAEDGSKNQKIEDVMKIFETRIESMKTHIGEPLEGVPNPKDITVYHNWDRLKQDITDHINQIKGVQGSGGILIIRQGIEHIEKSVTDYVKAFERFGDESSGGILHKWLDDILRSNPVREFLDKYVEENNGTKGNSYFVRTLKGADSIASKVKDEIIKKIGDSFRNPQITDGNVSANLTAIHQSLQMYCGGLDVAISTKVPEIVKAIGDDSTFKNPVTSVGVRHRQGFLKWALEAAVRALSSTAKQLAEQIKSFTDEGTIQLGANLTHISDKLEAIRNHVDKTKKPNYESSLGRIIDTALAESRRVINTLHTNLENAVGKSLNFQTGPDSIPKSGTAQAVDKAIEEVSSTVKDLDTTFTTRVKEHLEGAVTEFNSKAIEQIKQAATKAIDTALERFGGFAGEIHVKAMMRNFHDAEQALSGAVLLIDDQLSKLKLLPGDVLSRRKEADELMSDLKHKSVILQSAISGVERAVLDADDILTQAIDTLRKAINEARHTLTSEITTLQKDLTKTVDEAVQIVSDSIGSLKAKLTAEVQNAFALVTYQVRKLFAEGHKSDLKALQQLINVQLQTIKDIINKDMKNGVKGLIRTVSGVTPDGAIPHTGDRLSQLKNVLSPQSLTTKPTKEIFTNMSRKFQEYLDPISDYISRQLLPKSATTQTSTPVSATQQQGDTRKPQPPGRVGYSGPVATATTSTPKDPIAEHLDRLHYYVNGLFGTLSAGYFSRSFDAKLNDLTNFLTSMRPSTFAGIGSPLFDILTRGLRSLTTELGKAYISTYDTAAYSYQWTVDNNSENCAKVFLTILNTLCEDLPYLENKCKEVSKYSWKHKTISEKNDEKENALGCYLNRCGYAVAKDEHSKDGELNFPDRKYMGGHIYLKLNETKYTTDEHTKHLKSCESNLDEEGNPKTENNFTLFNLLDCLLHHLEKYNEVCHFSTLYSKARPCSAYEMLVWLSGLPHNPVYHDLLHDGIGNVLEEPKNSVAVVDGIPLLGQESSSLAAYPNDITWNSMKNAVEHLCAKAYDVLIGILGTGNELTIYGSDFSNNSFKFHYPSSGEECLDMLLDVLRRLFPVFRFIENQCRLTSQHYGWADCYYGKDVYPSDWQCKKHDAEKADCMPKSALMSYLTDSLPGHLPHRLKKIGCKFECNTCPGNRPGMPCLTPLGFRDFSGSKRTGKELSNVLTKFFGDVNLSRLLCLIPKPPVTLPEHFGFALSLEQGLSAPKSRNLETYKSFADTMDKSIKDVSILLYEHAERLTTPLRNAYGCTQNGNPSSDVKHADLSSLSTANTLAPAYCAPYLKSMCHDSYHYFSHKNSKLYLSWAIYSPWALHNYLVGLRDALKDIFCHDWRCTTCLHGDNCKRGEHGILHDSCKCDSVVSCRGVLPTLYKYGFAFADARELIKTKKTCFAICTQLQNVIKSSYFGELFKHCDNFLFTIRKPFIWLNVALWSLSLFYLICVMVGRLDVLHIRTHLRIPSSHKITAQSLLAAAQVGRLAKISYLQP